MKKFWTDNYPDGVKAQITCEQKTLNDFFDNVFGKYANRQFSSNMAVSYSYEQIDQISYYIAAWIQSLKLPQGSVIGLSLIHI